MLREFWAKNLVWEKNPRNTYCRLTEKEAGSDKRCKRKVPAASHAKDYANAQKINEASC